MLIHVVFTARPTKLSCMLHQTTEERPGLLTCSWEHQGNSLQTNYSVLWWVLLLHCVNGSFLFSLYVIMHASLLVCRARLWLNFADRTRPRAHPTSAVWKKCFSGDVTLSPWARNRLPGKLSPTVMRLHRQQYVRSIPQKEKNIPFFVHMFCIWVLHGHLIPSVNITRPELSVTTVSDSLLVEWKIRSCLSDYLYRCQLKYRVCEY